MCTKLVVLFELNSFVIIFRIKKTLDQGSDAGCCKENDEEDEEEEIESSDEEEEDDDGNNEDLGSDGEGLVDLEDLGSYMQVLCTVSKRIPQLRGDQIQPAEVPCLTQGVVL